ncbi:hypothetical protein A2U01_0006702 [Trifolium medium]|uniref:Uncharacterized protein n=1 Tax=Trifolium medium TaxID=97028 RepID=A0A392MED0_9FABA|nr:hypothetical protein [Trifolium medium]
MAEEANRKSFMVAACLRQRRGMEEPAACRTVSTLKEQQVLVLTSLWVMGVRQCCQIVTL